MTKHRTIEFTVQHPGDHSCSPQALSAGVRVALGDDKRAGDFEVLSYVNTSGSHTDYTVKVPIESAPTAKDEKLSDPEPAVAKGAKDAGRH
jgi:hypothetical protein